MKKVVVFLLAVILIVLYFGCNIKNEDPYDYSSIEDSYDYYWEEESLEPEPLPADGTVLEGSEGSTSEITITAPDEENCYVRLKNEVGGTVLGFFVNAGSTVTIGVPGQVLTVYFATGDTWYGLKERFGDETRYSKDDEPVDFSQFTIQYRLISSTNGNFSETVIDKDEF